MPDTQIATDLREFHERIDSMRRQTSDEAVSFYWRVANQFVDGYLPFALIGGLEWSEKHRHRLYSHDRRVWMKAALLDESSHISSGITTHDSVLAAGIRADIDRDNPVQAQQAIQKAITEVTILTDLLSLKFDTPIQWVPATYLAGFPVANPLELENRDVIPVTRSVEAVTNTNVTGGTIEEQILPLFSAVTALGDSPFAWAMRTAINWHAQGHTLQAGLSRFLAYWASVELLGTFLFDRLPPRMTGRKTKSERRDAILKLLKQPVTEATCFDRVDALNEAKQPTIRTKILVLSRWIGDDTTLKRALFDKVERHSLYSIRNDIAHGNVGSHHHDFLEVVRQRLGEMKVLSRSVILGILSQAAGIASLLDESTSK